MMFSWSQMLVGGNAPFSYNDQFLGEIASADFIDGPSLSSLVGLSAGIASNNTAGWLKFKLYTGETVFVAKRALRYRVSWNALNIAGVALGKTVTIGGKTYKCRLMKGAEADPSAWITDMGQTNPPIAASSEWNRLMYRSSVGNPGPATSWASYTNADLGILTSTGRMTICLETWGQSATIAIARANTSLTSFNYVNKPDGTAAGQEHYGWRPVLELIG